MRRISHTPIAPPRRKALAALSALPFTLHTWLPLAVTTLAAAAHAQAPETPLPAPASLQLAAKEAAARGEPLVLLISTLGCPYCEYVRRNYLAPMRAQGLAAFQIRIDDRKASVRDFQGRDSSGADIAQRYQAKFSPTVLFLDAQGQELAERLVGVSSTDFYGAYLDERLSTARGKLKPAS